MGYMLALLITGSTYGGTCDDLFILLAGISPLIYIMSGRSVISLQRQCCNQICRSGATVTEHAVHQLPLHMAPALLVAAVNAQQHDIASCIVSNWPLPTLRYCILYVLFKCRSRNCHDCHVSNSNSNLPEYDNSKYIGLCWTMCEVPYSVLTEVGVN